MPWHEHNFLFHRAFAVCFATEPGPSITDLDCSAMIPVGESPH
jgi:hypothetical protein